MIKAFIINTLKKIPFFFNLNSMLKAKQLENDIRKLRERYNQRVSQEKYSYTKKEQIKNFKERLQHLCPNKFPKKESSLNILWVGSLQSQDESGFIQGLKQMGHVVSFWADANQYGIYSALNEKSKFFSFEEMRAFNDQKIIEKVQHQKKVGLDLVIGQLWAHLVSPETISAIRKLGIPVINVSMDDRLPEHWQLKKGIIQGAAGLAPEVDMVLTTSKETCSWHALEGSPSIFWPLASSEELFYKQTSAQKEIDVLFIGNNYGIRKKYVDYLIDNDINVECYGRGWKNGYVNAEKNFELSKKAKIILGVGTVGHSSKTFTLKLRDFDAIATGALYITTRNEDLKEIFQEGHEIEFYDSKEELLEKIKFFLENPDQAELIGSRGRHAFLEKHTWKIRFIETFRDLGLIEA